MPSKREAVGSVDKSYEVIDWEHHRDILLEGKEDETLSKFFAVGSNIAQIFTSPVDHPY